MNGQEAKQELVGGATIRSRVSDFFRRVLTTRDDAEGRAPAVVPPGMRVYAVGDIHGRLDLLNDVIAGIEADIRARANCRPMIVFLGDYVDRGPHSFYVIERLIELQRRRAVVYLMGNHESLFARFIEDPSTLPGWAALGGLNTLMSYGLNPPRQPTAADGKALAEGLASSMPEDHRDFLANLHLRAFCGDYAFVHAGIRPMIPLDEQSSDDLLWIRDEFLSYDKPHERIIVHGHSPVMKPEIHANRINIDTGAYATGLLTCLVLEGAERAFLQINEKESDTIRVVQRPSKAG